MSWFVFTRGTKLLLNYDAFYYVSFFVPPPSLVVQLARDLQTDFYPHFPDFFILITSLLETKDTEILEWAFTCLSYLYKYLWRLMVKDISNIYR